MCGQGSISTIKRQYRLYSDFYNPTSIGEKPCLPRPASKDALRRAKTRPTQRGLLVACLTLRRGFTPSHLLVRSLAARVRERGEDSACIVFSAHTSLDGLVLSSPTGIHSESSASSCRSRVTATLALHLSMNMAPAHSAGSPSHGVSTAQAYMCSRSMAKLCTLASVAISPSGLGLEATVPSNRRIVLSGASPQTAKSTTSSCDTQREGRRSSCGFILRTRRPPSSVTSSWRLGRLGTGRCLGRTKRQ